MAHRITAVQNKSKDWKVVTILNAAGDLMENISVNRTNKKGETFPNFDDIQTGASVEGTLWESPAGKTYLFAPKGATTQKADSGPAANNPATQEIKNILMLKVIPQLDAIWGRLGTILKNQGMTTDDFKEPNFDNTSDLPF